MLEPGNLSRAVKGSLKGKNILVTLAGSIVAYIALVIFVYPAYTFQLLNRSLMYFPEVLRTSTISLFDTGGFIGLSLTLTYAALTGITLTNVYLSLKKHGLSEALNLGAFLPGFAVAGCAGCGVGLLAFLGFSGVVASLPFAGNLVKLGGVFLMLAILYRLGNTRTCSIPE